MAHSGQGMLYTFNDTTTVKRTVSQLIHNIDPQDIKMQVLLGTNNQTKFNILNFPNHKYEWLVDTYRNRTDAINDGTGISAVDTDITVDDASKFKPYDVIEIGTELILITTVDTTLEVLGDCVRGFAGSTAAIHADDAVVTYKYSARLEGDDSDSQPYTVPTNPFNYSQIFHAEINVSGSEMDATNRYGIADPYKYRLMQLIGGSGGGNGRPGRAGDLPLDLETTFFSRAAATQRTASVPGVMGGFKAFVTTNTTALSSATLEEDNLLDSMQTAWAAGGKPTLVVVNSFNKRLINSWYEGSIRTERSERTGGVMISTIENDFGMVDIVLHRECPASEVYIVDPSTVGWITLRDWQVQPLAKTGDSQKDQVIGEFGFVVTTEKANAIITGTATS